MSDNEVEKKQVEEEEPEDDDDEDEDDEEEEEDEERSGEGEEESDTEFDDPPDYVDDITDEELLADILKNKPVEETGYDCIIVVDNAPKVGADRMGKLKSVLNKVFGRFGEIVSQEYPVDDDGIFKGYFFMEFATADQAANAVKTGNGYRLDKSHVFAVNFFSDFDKYSKLPEKWEPPKKQEFKEVGNLRSWLLDENCFDQSAVIYNQGSQVAIGECTPQEIRIVTERDRWTETYLRWSPQGSYLATLHKPGVALWGGPKFDRVGRFEHSGVQLIDFSPCERYLVTFSNVVDDPNDPQNIIIWDVKTGARKRTFTRGAAEDWPILKWSHDGKYFARMTESLLSVYEVPSFGLLDKKSLVVKGIKDFLWCPTEHKIAYWVPELGQIPAKIIVVEIPSRKEVSTKNRHLVSECKLQWHKKGDYLCARVDRYTNKSRKQLCYSFDIFHMRESLIPVDTIEVKEPVVSFALEPTGSKFIVIHGEPPTRIMASFYNINDKGNKVTLLKSFRCNANHIFWSPSGQFVVLAGLKGMDGQLEFYDTSEITLITTAEHTQATDLEWDPSGRYIVTSVSYWTQKMDTGFFVWSFQGKLLFRNPSKLDKFCQLLWRPRPPSLLMTEDIATIKKDYKKYALMFEKKDRSIRSKASKDLTEKRRRLINEFRDYRKKKEEEMKQRKKTFGEDMVEEGEVEYEEESIEIFETEEEVLIE